jgi:hypothetical protein
MHKYILLLGLALLLIGSGCARASREANSAAVQVNLTAIPFPPYIGQTRLVIQVADDQGRPIDDAHLAIKGDMTHAGMIPVLAEVTGGTSDGVYEIPFEWTMAGDWVVTVDLLLPDGSTTRQRFDLSILSKSDDICEDNDPES